MSMSIIKSISRLPVGSILNRLTVKSCKKKKEMLLKEEE